MVTLSFGFDWSLSAVWGQRQFVQVLCDGSGSPVLWSGPASSPLPPHLVLTPLALPASAVSRSRSKPLRSDSRFRGNTGDWGQRGTRGLIHIQVSIFSNRWSLWEVRSITVNVQHDADNNNVSGLSVLEIHHLTDSQFDSKEQIPQNNWVCLHVK